MGPSTIWCDGLCMLWCDTLYTLFYKKKFIYIKKNLKNIYVCPSSKSAMRVGPVSVWVHVPYGVTDYVRYGVTDYVHKL